MNDWEAKYLALCAGITDARMIENAEDMVGRALQMCRDSQLTFDEAFRAMLGIVSQQLVSESTTKQRRN